MTAPSGVPAGFHTLTPYLIVKDAAAALAFYARALGAMEVMRLEFPGGGVMHAEMKLGDSIFMLSGEWKDTGNFSPETLGGTPVSLHVYCDDVAALYERAVAAGCKSLMPPTDMFWGDRMSSVQDPFGHRWSLAQHLEDLSPEEVQQRAAAAFSKPAC